MKPSKKSAASSTVAMRSPLPTGPNAEYREIPVHKLLDPITPARQTFDPDKMAELASSIQALGVIEPLCVEAEGENFRVHVGHRRLIAARTLGLETVPCRVYSKAAFSGEALKHHENRMREDLNPAEEARYFDYLCRTECGNDTDRLCELVQAKREYVEGRLLLLMGDERVFQALSEGDISMLVAGELNKVKDPSRRLMYLEACRQNGASHKMVREWRIDGNKMDEIMAAGGEPVLELPATAPATPLVYMPACNICGLADNSHELDILYVHRSCVRAMGRIQRKSEAVPVGE